MVNIAEVWAFPLIGLIAQLAASIYLVAIHRKIGWQLTEIFTGFNVLAYSYLAFVFYALFLAAHKTEETPLETFNIWFGLIYPVVNSIYHLRLKRFYKLGLEPYRSSRNNDKAGSPM